MGSSNGVDFRALILTLCQKNRIFAKKLVVLYLQNKDNGVLGYKLFVQFFYLKRREYRMPRVNAGSVDQQEFGAPAGATEAQVLLFRAKNGGNAVFTFDNVGEEDLTVSLNVSVDGVSFNSTAHAAVVIKPSGAMDLKLNCRESIDNYIEVTAKGGDRGQVQIRKLNGLEIIRSQA